MEILDLFSGIGGMSLGLERAGMATVGFCEIEPYCRRVLRHHWPDVQQMEDVRGISGHWWIGPRPRVIAGGFPCQDLSFAGKGEGLSGARSGLWFEFARLIGEFRPDWAIIENVPALRSRGLDQVLGSLAAIGYDAEWNCTPAAAFGAPHRRDRIWIVAYPHERSEPNRRPVGLRRGIEGEGEGEGVGVDPYPQVLGCGEGRTGRLTDRLAWIRNLPRWNPPNAESGGHSENGQHRCDEPVERTAGEFTPDVWQSRWTDEPALCGMDDGVPAGVDVGLYALGNSLIPQIAEAHGRAIMEWERDNARIS